MSKTIINHKRFADRAAEHALIDIDSRLAAIDADAVEQRVAIVRELIHLGEGQPDLSPHRLRRELLELDNVFEEYVEGTILRVALAATGEEYTTERKRLLAVFNELDERLRHRRFLLGPRITMPDLRLWTLLVRYDLGYNPLIKISKLRLVDLPQLWAYARDLYQLPPFRDTTDFAAIARMAQTSPASPREAPWRVLVEPYAGDWESPHGREALAAYR
ncbi:glutathione S-transferase C-terminal domain-containing protein [Acrocarpospora catenulata]|uniref:glutathione S-transferase C-terminal domain-containing protein n=1 Tax=Acrocarpospora catenulata TaxID=2836182 RepID=UPI001BDA29FB|nr:glutathione S-transferase C-terminal domain-containing protein [Acrocarpospora catenulata]